MKNTIYNVNSDNSCTMNISTQSMKDRTDKTKDSLSIANLQLGEANYQPSARRSQPLARRSQLSIIHCQLSILTALLIVFCLLVGGKAWGQSTLLTIYDGTTTNNVIPAYIFYFDDFTRSQFVIPAGDLEDMNGGTISSLKFYTTSSNVPYTTSCNVDVYLMEVNYTTMTALEPKSNATTVYTGTLSVVTEGSEGSLTIAFTTPYSYGGGNLLIGIENLTDPGYKNIYFYGQTVTGASWGGYNSSALSGVTGSQRNFIPKTTFTYTPSSTPSITLSPSSATILTGSTQTLTATRYNVSGTPTISYTSSNTSVATVSGSGTTATVTGVSEGSATITASMTYSGQTYTATCAITVIDACQPTWSGSSSSYYISNFTVSRSGTTLLNNSSTGTVRTTTNYYATKSITAEPGDELSCTITMSSSGTYGFALWVDFDKDGLEADDYKFKTSSYQNTPYTGTFTIPANTPAGEYRMRILGDYYTGAPSNPCGTYSNGEAEDYKLIVVVPTCPKPTNLTVSNITTTGAKLTWTPGGDETQWEVAYNTTGTPPSSGTNTTTTTHTFTGLTANTQYYAHVRAKCSSSDYSNWVTVPFRTTQKTPATIPYSHGFEDTESSENGNWILTSGVAQTNSWCRGTAEKRTGSYGLYITNNKNGTPPPNAYSHTASYVYAYREVNFTSTGEYTFSFDWKANGESTYDLLRAFLVPINLSSDLSDGTSNGMGSNTNTTPSGWIDIANPAGKLNLQTSWQSSEQTINISAGTYCLAFFWKNDGSGGTAPPAAVDNVSITTNAPPTYAITATANPAESGTVTFMTGPANSNAASTHLPLDSFRDNSFSQQIYTPEEIGGGSINSISLYSIGGNLNEDNIIYTRNLDVYLAHTNKAEFSSTTDWISNSDSPDMVKVYSGSVTFNCEEWNTINFTTTFNYDGTRNLLLVIADNTNASAEIGNYLECKAFTPSSGGNCSLNYGWGQFNPSSPSGNGELLTVKNQLLINGSSTRTFPQGASCTLVATANANYNFDNWTEGSTELSTNEVYTVSNITADHTIVGNFSLPTFTLTTSVNPSGGGTITCSPSSANGVYTYGTEVTLTANVATGYTFQNWTVDGETVNGSPTSVTMTANHNVVANFSINTYTVTYNANGGSGTMSNTSGQYNTSVTLSANGFTAPAGKMFDSWNTNSSGTGTSYTEGQSYTITGDITLYAQWVNIPREITISAPGVVCTSSETVLEVTNVTGFTNPQYTWSASPSAGAGLPANVHTSTITVTPDAGNYTYTCEVTEEGSSIPYSLGDGLFTDSNGDLAASGTACYVMSISGNTFTVLNAGLCGGPHYADAYVNTTGMSGVEASAALMPINTVSNMIYYLSENHSAKGWYIPSASEIQSFVSTDAGRNVFLTESNFNYPAPHFTSTVSSEGSVTVYGVTRPNGTPTEVYSSTENYTSSGPGAFLAKSFIYNGVSSSVTIKVHQGATIEDFPVADFSNCGAYEISPNISDAACSDVSWEWGGLASGSGNTATVDSYEAAASGTYTLSVTKSTLKQYDMITQNGIAAIVVVVPTVTTDGIAVPIGTSGIGTNTSAGSVADGALTNLQEAIKVNGGNTYSGTRNGFKIPAGAEGGVCVSEASVNVTINSVPEISISAPSAVCSGNTLTLGSPTITEHGSAVTSESWQISSNGGSSYSTFNTSTQVTSTHNGNLIRYFAHNGCGDGFSDPVTITVNPIPTPTITQANNYTELTCARTSITLTANGIGGTFAWSGDGTGTGSTLSVDSDGTYYVTENKNGCSGTSTGYVITSNTTAPTVSVTGTNEICLGESTTLQTTSNANYTYSWSNSVTTYNNPVTPTATTTYTVDVTDNTNGCSAIGSRVVTVNTPPSSLSSYNYIWRGATSTDWNTVSNWYVYNSGYSVATELPTTAKNIYIGSGQCITAGSWPQTMSGTAEASANSITVASGATLIIPENKTLNIKEDFTIDGTFTAHNNSTLVFLGDNNQTVTGAMSLGNVTFAQAANGKKIIAPNGITVNGLATFTKGIVSGPLTFVSGASTTGANLACHVDGQVTKYGNGAFTFPTGNNGFLGTLAATIANNSTGVTVRFNNESADGHGFSTEAPDNYPRWWNINDMCGSDGANRFDHVSNYEYWNLGGITGSTSLSDITLKVDANTANAHFHDGATSNGVNANINAAAHYDCWKNMGGSANIENEGKTITISGITGLSATRGTFDGIVTIGSKSEAIVLPIELTSFTATCYGKSALVEWTTATERNNDYFIIERSDDAFNFTEIARVAGAGNSIDPIDYAYTDYGIHGGDNYYRLVQVDYDGTRTVSEVIVANCIEETAGEPDVMAYPNPFSGELTVVLDNFGDRPATVEVYDMLGKLIVFEKVASPQNSYEAILNLSNLPPAAYNIRVSTADFVINRKVVKQ